jgi:hypothetical protein
MNTAATAAEVTPTAPGTPFAGGFYAGRINIDGAAFALIVAPKAEGQLKDQPWNKSTKNVDGALSYFDGYKNTLAMADAGSKLARAMLDLRIAGHDDWYLPSLDELEVVYRHLKPTTEENYALGALRHQRERAAAHLPLHGDCPPRPRPRPSGRAAPRRWTRPGTGAPRSTPSTRTAPGCRTSTTATRTATTRATATELARSAD